MENMNRIFFFQSFFKRDEISFELPVKYFEVNRSLMINYSKSENSRSFDRKIGAKNAVHYKNQCYLDQENNLEFNRTF